MVSVQQKISFVAAFVFAAGFASVAYAQDDPRCDSCVSTYDYCVSQSGPHAFCARDLKDCLLRYGCPTGPQP